MKRIAALIVIGLIIVLFATKANLFSQGRLWSGLLLSRIGGVISISNSDLLRELDQVKQENALLKAQILDEKIFKPSTVEVYSTYPLNGKKDIAIAAGSADGVHEGSVVTWGESVLIGKVTSTTEHSSVVATIFDPSWEMAVRIGESQENALFKGGNIPKATLIPRSQLDAEKNIKSGDLIVTASKDFPCGLEVGKIKNISDTSGTLFREATIDTEIQISDLRYVTVHN
jgi:rod shape-determining protein MreC